MRDIRTLLQWFSYEELKNLLVQALKIAQENPQADWATFQHELHVGAGTAYLIQDWLSDDFRVEPRMSAHWVRCGRTYVLNNDYPSMGGLMERVQIGLRTAYKVMLELEKRRVIRIRMDFSFERLKTASDQDLIRQMKQIAKKYRGRCEPELLMRRMYIDASMVERLSAYGAKELGLRPQKWRGS